MSKKHSDLEIAHFKSFTIHEKMDVFVDLKREGKFTKRKNNELLINGVVTELIEDYSFLLNFFKSEKEKQNDPV